MANGFISANSGISMERMIQCLKFCPEKNNSRNLNFNTLFSNIPSEY